MAQGTGQVQTMSATLANVVWPAQTGEGLGFLRSATLVFIGTLLITLSAKTQVPFLPVPMTLQSLVIAVIAAAYGFRLGTATIFVYLCEGMFGLPVFANTPPQVAGPAYFLGGTAGFLLGFVFMTAMIGLAADKGWSRSPVKLLGIMTLGNIVLFACGFLWLATFAHLSSGAIGMGFAKAYDVGVAPFYLASLVKIALGALIVPALWNLAGARHR